MHGIKTSSLRETDGLLREGSRPFHALEGGLSFGKDPLGRPDDHSQWIEIIVGRMSFWKYSRRCFLHIRRVSRSRSCGHVMSLFRWTYAKVGLSAVEDGFLCGRTSFAVC